LKQTAIFFLLATNTIIIKMAMLTLTALITRFLFAPLLSDKEPLFFLKARLLLPSESVAEAVLFGSLVEEVETVRELVF